MNKQELLTEAWKQRVLSNEGKDELIRFLLYDIEEFEERRKKALS